MCVTSPPYWGLRDYGSEGQIGLIVTERLVEKFAEARGWKPEECELVLVTEEPSGRVMWGGRA